MTDATDDRIDIDEAAAIDPAPPVTLVIFGATGDLTRRLLVPALINMTGSGLVDDSFHVLGIGIEPGDDEMLRQRIDDFLKASGHDVMAESDAWASLRPRLTYLSGDLTQDALYEEITARLAASPSANAAFYLATQPGFFGQVIEKLSRHGLMKEADGRYRRVAIEKPFGHDLASAQALNAQILGCVDEAQVYRIDHFLGKETVQNIMTTRFANMMFEGLWNNNFIDSVQITAAETVGVGTRGKFYDATGALRDMVPNHLFQLLAMIGMEAPNSFDAEAIRTEKGKVLKAIRRYTPEEAAQNGVRGAFTAGTAGGEAIAAYTATADIAPDSRTETYVALKLMVDTWRWAGVPFYLRTGKAMAVRDTEIVVTFKQVPFAQFANTEQRHRPPGNKLIIQIQPDEGISMDIAIKRPGLDVAMVPVALDFRYSDMFDIASLTGYESLVYDLLVGDQTLFQRADGIEAGWAAVQPFLECWVDGPAPEPYAPGSIGPDAAAALIERDGRRWHVLAPRV